MSDRFAAPKSLGPAELSHSLPPATRRRKFSESSNQSTAPEVLSSIPAAQRRLYIITHHGGPCAFGQRFSELMICTFQRACYSSCVRRDATTTAWPCGGTSLNTGHSPVRLVPNQKIAFVLPDVAQRPEEGVAMGGNADVAGLPRQAGPGLWPAARRSALAETETISWNSETGRGP